MQSALSRIIFHLIFGALLTLVYPWNDLFTGNQQVYLLWAADASGFGNFQADPLLSQADPFPAFTYLATAVFSVLPIGFFHVIYCLLNAVYSYALFAISDRFTGIYQRFRTAFVFAILFLFFHSAEIWGTFFSGLSGHDIRWIWDSGLAEQGVLRGYLQPSVLGVFMLMGVHQLIEKNWLFSAVGFALASVFHANYLILCWAALALLVLFLLIRKSMDGAKWKAVGLYGVLTIPYGIYIFQNFLPDADTISTVVNHSAGNPHLDLSTWLNLKTALQLTVFGVSVFFTIKTNIGKWMATVFAVSAVLTIAAFLLPDTPLMSLNPWRTTVVLFPVSVALLLGLISQSLRPGNYYTLILIPLSVVLVALLHLRLFGSADPEARSVWRIATLSLMGIALVLGWFIRMLPKGFLTQIKNTLALGSITLLMASGVVGKFIEKRTLKQQPWAGAANFARSNSQPGDLYLIPLHINNFRMNARVAIVSDPLVVHGATLADQYRINELAQSCFEDEVFDVSKLVGLSNLPITNVLTRSPDPSQNVIYQDDHFAIIELR